MNKTKNVFIGNIGYFIDEDKKKTVSTSTENLLKSCVNLENKEENDYKQICELIKQVEILHEGVYWIDYDDKRLVKFVNKLEKRIEILEKKLKKVKI